MLSHNWENIKTIQKYLSRARKRTEFWQHKLQEQIIALGGSILGDALTERPDTCILPRKLVQQLAVLLHEKLRMDVMDKQETRQWFLALLSASKMGLGPP
jgi:hypothetical protein